MKTRYQYKITVKMSAAKLGDSYNQMEERLDESIDHFVYRNDGKRIEAESESVYLERVKHVYIIQHDDFNTLRELFISHARDLQNIYKADVKGEYSQVTEEA